MSRISIADDFEGVEVDLWEKEGGGVFKTVPATRSVSKKATELMSKFDEIEDEDKAVEILAKMLDLRLVPANGKRVKASTIVQKKWEADELTFAQLERFAQRFQEAERPT